MAVYTDVSDEQLSGREIVTKAMELLRANYVFPDEAERAAAAIEARLEAGAYDGLDEITLTDRVTGHLQDITGDKHLGLRLGGGPGPRREPQKRPDREKMRAMEAAGITTVKSPADMGATVARVVGRGR